MATLRIEFMQDLLEMFEPGMRAEADKENMRLNAIYGKSSLIEDDQHISASRLYPKFPAWQGPARDLGKLATVPNVDTIDQVVVMFQRATMAEAERKYTNWKSRRESRDAGGTLEEMLASSREGNSLRDEDAAAEDYRSRGAPRHALRIS